MTAELIDGVAIAGQVRSEVASGVVFLASDAASMLSLIHI